MLGLLVLSTVLIFFLGACVGSFLNVIIDRTQGGESFTKGRSHCDKCKHSLNFFDLIPLLSYTILNGKCRYCKTKLSGYYPVTEIMTGLLFVLVVGNLGHLSNLGNLVYHLFIISTLIVIFFTDLKYGIIPFKVVVAGIIVTFLWYLFFPIGGLSILNYFLSGFGAFVVFGLLFAITKGAGMGFGDVVFVFYMGILLGYPRIILGIYIAFVSGAIVSLLLIMLKLKKLKKDTIPFGPFLVFGTLLSMYAGSLLIDKFMIYLIV